MLTQTESLAERVERLLEESREPLVCTTSTCAAIAELASRIETLELAIREIADAAGAAASPRDAHVSDGARIALDRGGSPSLADVLLP
jgi:hypothetical protein